MRSQENTLFTNKLLRGLFTYVPGRGDWAHFMGNAAYLLLLGPMLEEKYPSPSFARKMYNVPAVNRIPRIRNQSTNYILTIVEKWSSFC